MITKDGVGWKQKAHALSVRADRLHRSVLDKDVIRGALPLRARLLAHRSALPESCERERCFRHVSPAYAQTVDNLAPPDARLRQITVDGLTWWAPLPRPDDAAQVARALHHQDFPYRLLTQTRELAIGGTMLDIGANVGRMSIPRVILGDATIAYCAEPDPVNYECLVRNARDNKLCGLVLPDRVALGSINGTVALEQSRTAGGHKVVDADRRTNNRLIDVPASTFDAWVARLGVDLAQVTFVKIDVQGSEVEVLRGAGTVLARPHIAWQIEVDPALLRVRRAAPQDLFAIMEQHFTHFIDLGRNATGDRARRVTDLAEALGYLAASPGSHTDLLLCNLETSASSHR